MIDAGDFRYYFKAYKPNEVIDRVGQTQLENEFHSEFYGTKYQWQNREKYEGKQLIESDIIVIRTYFDKDINTSFLIEDENGKMYNVKGVKEIEYNTFMEITAQYKSNR